MRHREELAQSIARLIVPDNMPWTLARERVMQASSRYANMPNAAEIGSAVRENFALFKPEKHAQSLLRKRRSPSSTARCSLPIWGPIRLKRKCAPA